MKKAIWLLEKALYLIAILVIAKPIIEQILKLLKKVDNGDSITNEVHEADNSGGTGESSPGIEEPEN